FRPWRTDYGGATLQVVSASMSHPGVVMSPAQNSRLIRRAGPARTSMISCPGFLELVPSLMAVQWLTHLESARWTNTERTTAVRGMPSLAGACEMNRLTCAREAWPSGRNIGSSGLYSAA